MKTAPVDNDLQVMRQQLIEWNDILAAFVQFAQDTDAENRLPPGYFLKIANALVAYNDILSAPIEKVIKEVGGTSFDTQVQ